MRWVVGEEVGAAGGTDGLSYIYNISTISATMPATNSLQPPGDNLLLFCTVGAKVHVQ